MVFGNSQGPAPATNMAFPDVCMTPGVAAGAPAPLPYPNISVSSTGIPTQFTTLLTAMPAHNMTTQTAMSNGDEAGLNFNLISGMFMGPTRHLMGSVTTFLGGLPATRMLSPSGQNGMSPGAFGTCISPSQVTTMFLS